MSAPTKSINCYLCNDRGVVPVDKPVPAEVNGIEFDYIQRVPCPMCPAGYRKQLATEERVILLDREE